MARVKSLSQLQSQIYQWQIETFGGQAPKHFSRKLGAEVFEMLEAVDGGGDTAPEIADCFIVLFGLASSLGVNAEEAIEAKMAINRKRKWKKEKDGTFQHIGD